MLDATAVIGFFLTLVYEELLGPHLTMPFILHLVVADKHIWSPRTHHARLAVLTTQVYLVVLIQSILIAIVVQLTPVFSEMVCRHTGTCDLWLASHCLQLALGVARPEHVPVCAAGASY